MQSRRLAVPCGWHVTRMHSSGLPVLKKRRLSGIRSAKQLTAPARDGFPARDDFQDPPRGRIRPGLRRALVRARDSTHTASPRPCARVERGLITAISSQNWIPHPDSVPPPASLLTDDVLVIVPPRPGPARPSPSSPTPLPEEPWTPTSLHRTNPGPAGGLTRLAASISAPAPCDEAAPSPPRPSATASAWSRNCA